MSAPALDIEQPAALLGYLRAAGRIAPEEAPRVRVLAGGVSNRTVLLERANGEAWVLKQALEQLRTAAEWHCDPSRIESEALGMHHLALLAEPGAIPALLFQDAAQHLLAMAAVPEPHANWKTLLLRGEVVDEHVRQFGHLLGTIHRRSQERAAELAELFEKRAFFETLRLEPYYAYSAERCPAAASFLHALIAETRATRHALVHGDYSPKNVLVHEGRLILLDHEVIHWGDPAFDLGFSLAHLLSKAHHLAPRRALFAEAAARYWRAYGEALGEVPWGEALPARAVRHALACLLARVAGRSPLEYLSESERARQAEAVIDLMAAPPNDVPMLIESFRQRIEEKEKHGRH